MSFGIRLNEALDSLTRYNINTDSEAYQKVFKSISLNESTMILAGRVLNELKAKDIVTRMAMLAQREKRALDIHDFRQVIAASLRAEGFGGGSPEEVKKEVANLTTDQGVLQSIKLELGKMKIQFDSEVARSVGRSTAPVASTAPAPTPQV